MLNLSKHHCDKSMNINSCSTLRLMVLSHCTILFLICRHACVPLLTAAPSWGGTQWPMGGGHFMERPKSVWIFATVQDVTDLVTWQQYVNSLKCLFMTFSCIIADQSSMSTLCYSVTWAFLCCSIHLHSFNRTVTNKPVIQIVNANWN